MFFAQSEERQALIKTMNQPIRQAQGEKGFSAVAGIIIGLVILAAVVAGIFFFKQAKTRQEIKKMVESYISSILPDENGHASGFDADRFLTSDYREYLETYDGPANPVVCAQEFPDNWKVDFLAFEDYKRPGGQERALILYRGTYKFSGENWVVFTLEKISGDWKIASNRCL